MPTRIARDFNDLSIYQEFANRATTGDDEVVFSVDKTKAPAASLTSASTETTLQKIYRWLFGQKKSDIVNEFSMALEAKYGKDVASFAFSETQKNQALNAGLSKRIIAEVLKNARFARNAQDDLKAYASMAGHNIEIVKHLHPEIDLSELHDKFKKVQDFANRPLSAFENVDTLQEALQEAISVATTSKKILEEKIPASLKVKSPTILHHEEELARPKLFSKETDRGSISPTTIAIDTDFEEENRLIPNSFSALSDEIDSTWRDIPDALITEEAFQASLEATRHQHQEVVSELKARFRNNPKALEAQLAKLAGAVAQAIQQAAPELMVFAQHVHDDPSNYFRLDAHGAIVVAPADFPNARLTAEDAEENRKVWHLFCSTLETCYGKPLLERMIPEEKREALFSTPLSTADVKQTFEEIQHSLKIDLEFLKNQPFIVDDQYCDALSTHPELLEKALQAEREAAAGGTLSIQIGRKLFDVGVLSAGYHAGGLVATGVATTVTTMTGVAVPIIPLTFVASILCSWMAGRIVGSRTSQEVSSFAANRAAVYTIGGTSTKIVTEPLIDLLRDYLTSCLTHLTLGPEGAEAISFLTEFALEEGGSILADNIRRACVGSIVNGIDVAALPAPPNELHPTQAVDMDLRIIDVLQDMAKAVNQLSPPASHEQALKRTRIRL